MRILNVVGARPNFMKIGPIHRQLLKNNLFEPVLVHTGQHYDERMSDIFFRQMELPEPDIYLGIGGGSHAVQTARIMQEFEGVLEKEHADMVVVVGDVNSTLACSLVAVKMHIPVAHVEAGLRSRDRGMPEEINRIVTDSISDYLFVTEQSGLDNLRSEGVADEKVFFVGNVMIDSLVHFLPRAREASVAATYGLADGGFALMTMHRPANVDNAAGLNALVEILQRVSSEMTVVFPVHPRTRLRMEEFALKEAVEALDNVRLIDPLGYLEFLDLMSRAAVVITDSGGIQEETTYLRVPCLTLRDSTERPVTVELGTNQLLPLDPQIVHKTFLDVCERPPSGEIPPLWDGHAAERIVQVLQDVAGQ
ncbi:MAG: UDP-N-acetylglucosamine 2-epimerase (non-hydrolyzing) [Rhodothermales bacterium]|nr:UDP-N-acetylglucosamine 2-epimerase (non-hydrolyzing) [Rhodothermales bacterium]